jgi:hypothetical protein
MHEYYKTKRKQKVHILKLVHHKTTKSDITSCSKNEKKEGDHNNKNNKN